MLTIASLEEHHVDLLIPSFIKAFNDGEWHQQWTDETARASLLNLMHFPHFYGLVAFSDECPVGALLGHIQVFNDTRTYYIDELFVDPAYQKQGIATELYAHARTALKTSGISGAFFTTLRNSSAYAFYISQGAKDLSDSAVFYHYFN